MQNLSTCAEPTRTPEPSKTFLDYGVSSSADSSRSRTLDPTASFIASTKVSLSPTPTSSSIPSITVSMLPKSNLAHYLLSPTSIVAETNLKSYLQTRRASITPSCSISVTPTQSATSHPSSTPKVLTSVLTTPSTSSTSRTLTSTTPTPVSKLFERSKRRHGHRYRRRYTYRRLKSSVREEIYINLKDDNPQIIYRVDLTFLECDPPQDTSLCTQFVSNFEVDRSRCLSDLSFIIFF